MRHPEPRQKARDLAVALGFTHAADERRRQIDLVERENELA
jgi:hypothetical protein